MICKWYRIMKRKFKQWRSTFPSILSKGTYPNLKQLTLHRCLSAIRGIIVVCSLFQEWLINNTEDTNLSLNPFFSFKDFVFVFVLFGGREEGVEARIFIYSLLLLWLHWCFVLFIYPDINILLSNSATCLNLFKERNWGSNTICRGFFVINGLRWEIMVRLVTSVRLWIITV